MADNGYQSGGRNNGFRSPDAGIQKSVERQLIKDAADGDIKNITNMSLDELNTNLLRASEGLLQYAELTDEAKEKFSTHIQNLVSSADNAQQAFKAVSGFVTKFGITNLEAAQSIQKVRGTDPNNQSNLGKMNQSPFLQSVQIQQKILDRLNEMGSFMNGMNETMLDTNKDINQGQDEEEGLFDTLKDTIRHSIFNSPTATKLGTLGASLMSAGLFRMASNDKLPSWARQAAMGAVYLQVPQTVMNILGATFQTWLTTQGSQLLGNALKNIATNAGSAMSGMLNNAGGIIMKALPIALPLILAGAGIFALIKGIIDHKKNMKENDARIDNDPTLTQSQKDMKKLGAHTASGAKTGAVSGALIGAAIGTAIAPGIGTLIGGAIGGGALGAGIGGLIGSIKPLGNMFKHGMSVVGDKVTTGAKWALERGNQVLKMLTPIAKTMIDLFVMINPFFRMFKVLADKIMSWKFFGGSDNGGQADEGMGVGDKAKAVVANIKGNYKANVAPDKNGLVKMSSLGLKGKIDAGNSIPSTLKDNAYNVQQLDHILAGWGYGVTYTSNMGGMHKTGEKSHSSGNKLDLQLTKNGKIAKLSQEQLNYLGQLGYWGGNTGALGWEAVAGQVGGGHYDLHIGKQVQKVQGNEYLAGLQKKYEDEKNSKNNKEKEAAELIAKQSKPNEVIKNVAQPTAQYLGNSSFKDVTGTDVFTRMNSTGAVVNIGANT